MQSHAWFLGYLVLVGLVACGGDDGGGNTCGVGSTDGIVMGTQVSPVRRAALVPAGSNFQLVIDEVAGTTCGDPGLTGEHLVVLFCNMPTATTFPVVDEATFGCPGANAYAALERDGATEYAKATGGEIVIDTTAGCLRGDFMLTFGADTLTGSFDAIVCQ